MNYNIVVDTSQFKPYNFDNAFRVLNSYRDLYEKQQAIYDKISQTLGDLASAVEGSDEAKKLYDAYLQRFNAAAEDFSSGMDMRTAKELGQLRLLYGTLIRQLEKANEARVKAAEYLRAKNKDDEYMHESLGTLDDWMKNPNRDIRGYSGTLLTGKVSALSKAVGQSIASIQNDGRLDPYVKKYKKYNGFTRQDVDTTISEVQQGGIKNVTNPIMLRILLNAMDSSGIYDWADEDTKRRAEIIAASGLTGGIGKTEINTYADEEGKANLQLRLEREKQRLKLLESLLDELNGISGKGKNPNLNGTIPFNAIDISSPNYELKTYLRTLELALNTLGIRKKDDGTLGTRKVNVPVAGTLGSSINIPSPSAPGLSNNISNLTKEFSLYHSNGAMMTRYKFIQQGETDREKKALADYYDNNVENALKTLNMSSAKELAKAGKVHKLGEVANYYNKAYKGTGSLNAAFVPLPMSNSLEILDRLVERMAKDGKLPAGTIKEVISWDKHGNIELDTRNIDVSLLDEGKAPEFYSYIGRKLENGDRTELSKYLIFKKNGKTYAIPKYKLGTVANTAERYADDFDVLKHTKDRSIQLMALEQKERFRNGGIEISDEQALALGEAQYEKSLENDAAAYVRALGLALGLEYKSSAFDLHTNSNSGKIQP